MLGREDFFAHAFCEFLRLGLNEIRNYSNSAGLLGQVIPLIAFLLIVYDQLLKTHLSSAYILKLVTTDLRREQRNKSRFALLLLVVT